MPIHVNTAQLTGLTVDSNTVAGHTLPGSVSVGRMVVVLCAMWNNGSAFGPFTSASCTKTGGTSTIGTITLAAEEQRATGGAFEVHVGIWTALVTGAGTCTMQVGTFPAGSFSWIALMEAEATLGWDANRVEATAVNSGNSAAPSSGNAAGSGQALFVGGLATDLSALTSITPDGAFTTIFESEDGTAHQTGSSIYRIANATTDAADWTIGSADDWAAALAVFRESSAANAVRQVDRSNFPKTKLRRP